MAVINTKNYNKIDELSKSNDRGNDSIQPRSVVSTSGDKANSSDTAISVAKVIEPADTGNFTDNTAETKDKADKMGEKKQEIKSQRPVGGVSVTAGTQVGYLNQTQNAKGDEGNVPDKYEQLKNKKMKYLVIILVVFVVIFAATFLYKAMQDRRPVPTPTIIPPTPVPYQHYRPSVYAKDKDLLAIEEDLKVLERELNQPLQKESYLELPVLDYQVSFEEAKKR